MAKKKQSEPVAVSETAPVVESATVAEPTVEPAVPTLANYVVSLGYTVDSPRGPRRFIHAWLPWSVTVENCVSAEDAVEKMVAELRRSVFQVEQVKR